MFIKGKNAFLLNKNVKSILNTFFTYAVFAALEKLEFGMYPQSMPTEWTHVRTVRA